MMEQQVDIKKKISYKILGCLAYGIGHAAESGRMGAIRQVGVNFSRGSGGGMSQRLADFKKGDALLAGHCGKGMAQTV